MTSHPSSYVGTRVADIAADAGFSEAERFREVVARIDADSRWFEPDSPPEAFVAQMRAGEVRYHLDARWRALDHVWAEALGGGHPDRRQHALLLLAVSYGARVLRRYDPEAVSAEEAADLLAFAARSVVEDLGKP